MAKGSIIPADESRSDDLKPTVIIHQPEEKTWEIEEEKITDESKESKVDKLLEELEMQLEEELSCVSMEQLETKEDIEPPVEEFELLEILRKDIAPTMDKAPVEEEDIPEWAPIEEEIDDPFMVGDYTLYTKVVTLRGDRKQRIYFFSKKKKKDAAAIKKPRGYKVVINKKTGLPLLKKKTLNPFGKQKQ
jgi:hypothetical protein